MKITIVTIEYNPMHNGHVYHIEKTRERFPDNYIVGVMSGSFTMRGEPAVLDKFTRARLALENGLDAVIELPVFSSFLCGEKFAKSSMRIAKEIQAYSISFGSECGDISLLQEINDIILHPTEEFATTFKSNIADGKSYPRAICETVSSLYPNKPYKEVLSEPNNSLALMYLRAIQNTEIKPFTVRREDCGFHSSLPCGKLLSASGIREHLQNGKTQQLSAFLPSSVLDELEDFDRELYTRFSTLVLFKIRMMERQEFRLLHDVSEGLENRFEKYKDEATTLNELLEKVKTKRYTLSRLKRIATYALLGVYDDTVKAFESAPFYARLLAIKKDEKDLLAHLKKCGITTCYSDIKDDISKAFWSTENAYASIHSLLLNKPITDKNTLFI